MKFENTRIVGISEAVRLLRSLTNTLDEFTSKDLGEYAASTKDGKFQATYDCELTTPDRIYAKMAVLDNMYTDSFLQMTTCYVDITASIHFWSDFPEVDAVILKSLGQVTKERMFSIDDFDTGAERDTNVELQLQSTVDFLNKLRIELFRDEDISKFGAISDLLPASYNVTKMVKLDYSLLRELYHLNKDADSPEWVSFINWVESLPYSSFITLKNEVE